MSTGTMPVAALAATLLLALPAADAAAGAPSPHKPQAGPAGVPPPEQITTAVPDPVQLVELNSPSAPRPRRPKQPTPGARSAAADHAPSRLAKPGAKPRHASPVPRQAVARPAASSRPPLRQVAHRPGEAAGHTTTRPLQSGVASYYSRRFDGRLMANGERFDPYSDSIAHRSLPFGTRVRIVNMTNGRSFVGTVRDRGPYARGRLLDVSPRIAGELGMLHSGIARVTVWRDGETPVEIAEAPP